MGWQRPARLDPVFVLVVVVFVGFSCLRHTLASLTTNLPWRCPMPSRGRAFGLSSCGWGRRWWLVHLGNPRQNLGTGRRTLFAYGTCVSYSSSIALPFPVLAKALTQAWTNGYPTSWRIICGRGNGAAACSAPNPCARNSRFGRSSSVCAAGSNALE